MKIFYFFNFNEPKKEDLMKKLKQFGIDNLYKLLNSDFNNMQLKIGQKKLFNKFMKVTRFNLIDIDVLKYLISIY